MVYVFSYYGGPLAIDKRSEPVYTGGTLFPMQIHSSCIFEELKEEIFKVTRIYRDRERIQIVCKWPIAIGESTTLNFSDDRETSIVWDRVKRIILLLVRNTTST